VTGRAGIMAGGARASLELLAGYPFQHLRLGYEELFKGQNCTARSGLTSRCGVAVFQEPLRKSNRGYSCRVRKHSQSRANWRAVPTANMRRRLKYLTITCRRNALKHSSSYAQTFRPCPAGNTLRLAPTMVFLAEAPLIARVAVKAWPLEGGYIRL